MRRLVSANARRGFETVLGRTEPQIEWRANQLDFAVASTINRARVRLLKPRRNLEALTRRLEAQVAVLDEASSAVGPEASAEIDTRKEHVTWLLNELRRQL
ncbi:MAG TPA: hypothetical protein VHF89_08555 [Solirubrobacteraceae bacterium]|nr:hypothetical protein [Solirubrobacteraceae bacterium]